MSTTARETTTRFDDRSRSRASRPSHRSRDFTRGGTSELAPASEDGEERRRSGDDRGRRRPHLNHRAPTPNRAAGSPGKNLHATPVRSGGFQRKTGSRQVLSVRGRRVSSGKRTSLVAKLLGVSVVLLGAGVALAMMLSGISTEQTFRMQQLVAREAQLNNQLETLNRDLEDASSSAELARRASEMGMAVPEQPGVLRVEDNGDIVEQRPSEPGTRPIIDINGQADQPNRASSNPTDTEDLGDNLEAVPQGETQSPPEQQNGQGGPAEVPGVVPYEADTAPEQEPPGDEQAGEDVQ